MVRSDTDKKQFDYSVITISTISESILGVPIAGDKIEMHDSPFRA